MFGASRFVHYMHRVPGLLGDFKEKMPGNQEKGSSRVRHFLARYLCALWCTSLVALRHKYSIGIDLFWSFAVGFGYRTKHFFELLSVLLVNPNCITLWGGR